MCRKLSIQYHPDKNPGHEAKFREVSVSPELRWREVGRPVRSDVQRALPTATMLCAVTCAHTTRRQITEAYEILYDKERRVLYDFSGISAARKGLEGQQQGGGSPFDMFFGGGQQQQNDKRGRNMDIELPVTLEDLYVGNEKSASIKRRARHDRCRRRANRSQLRSWGRSHPCGGVLAS